MGREPEPTIGRQVLLDRATAIYKGGTEWKNLHEHFAPVEWPNIAGDVDRLAGLSPHALAAGPVWRDITPPAVRDTCRLYQRFDTLRQMHHTRPNVRTLMAILCRNCWCVSYHADDALNLYCGRCKRWHDITQLVKQELAKVVPQAEAREQEGMARLANAIENGDTLFGKEQDLVTIIPPEAGSIEQLLQRHPQTENLSPFALAVARCLREPMR